MNQQGLPPNPKVDVEDTEGHAFKSGRAAGTNEDTEGHGYRPGGITPPQADDTEGHAFRGNIVEGDRDETD